MNVVIAEAVEFHTPARNAPAVQNQSGKTELCERLQTAKYLPVHAIVPGKLSRNVVKLRTAVNIVDERPGIFSIFLLSQFKIQAFGCLFFLTVSDNRIRPEEKTI